MAILVIRKPTNLEQHGEVVRSQAATGGLDSSQLDILREAHQEHYQCVDAVRSSLADLNLDYIEIQRGDKRPAGTFTAVITVGGDGTLLSASHSIVDDHIPLIGFRSSRWSVGYLCVGGVDDVASALKAFKDGALNYKTRQRLKAKVFRAKDRSEKETFSVLNDFLYTNSNPASTTRYRILYNGAEEVQKSSGLWVSTATGSTAAISAAGGDLLQDTDTRLQFVVRELYRFDKLDNQISKGYFDGVGESLVIDNHCASGILALDGERGVIRLKFGDSISFLRAKPILVAAPLSSTST